MRLAESEIPSKTFLVSLQLAPGDGCNSFCSVYGGVFQMAGYLPLTRPKRMSAVTGRPMISPDDISSTAPPGGNVVSMTGNCSDGIGVKATGNWKDGSRPETNGVRRRRNRSLLDENNFKRNSRLLTNV